MQKLIKEYDIVYNISISQYFQIYTCATKKFMSRLILISKQEDCLPAHSHSDCQCCMCKYLRMTSRHNLRSAGSYSAARFIYIYMYKWTRSLINTFRDWDEKKRERERVMNQRPQPQRHGKGAFSCRARIANEISRRRGDDHRNDKQCGAIINHRPTDPTQLARVDALVWKNFTRNACENWRRFV